MTKIPVVIVDDEEADRYIVRRRLAKSEDFEQVIECTTGDEFLEQFFNGHGGIDPSSPLLVLMDINMPRMGGFETIEELQRRMAEGRGPKSVVIMMFTSSDNENDRARADALSSVKGYVLKPLDDDAVEDIVKVYNA